MPDTTTDAAREEHAAIHEFTVARLRAILRADGNPRPFATALLTETIAVMQILDGPDMTARSLVEAAEHLIARGEVAGNA